MAITKKIIHKNKDGSTITVDIGVVGKNVEEDSTHRFSTDTEKANWNDANSKKHTHTNKTVLDGITTALVTAWNNAATHISDTVKHITSTERTNWNDAKTKADSAIQTIMINGSTQTKANGVVNLPAYPSSISGNAETANKLKTARKIGNASFDGSADISLSQIGVAAASHTHSNYVNQNAFSNVTVGNTTIAADNTTDTLTLAAGSNVTLTPDATNDKITISATDTKFIHPSYTSKANGLYKITIDGTGHVSATSAVTKADITTLGIPAQDTNTTYGVATASALGLVKSGTDITVDASGNVSVVDDSHNHVISNVDGLQTALNGKATSSHAHQNYMNQNAEAFDNTKNFDTYTTAGHYSVRGCYNIVDLNGPDGAYYDGTLLVFTSKSQKGVDYDSVTQIYLSDYYKKIHYRMKEGTEGWWFGWYTIQDTVYTHPSYPSKSDGLYKITVDETGHVSATNAVTKADITNLGIASSDSAIFTNNISMGRKEGTIIGNKSAAIGYYTTASGEYSHAEGCYTEAIGTASHAEGYGTGNSKNTAYGKGSHAEGINTTAGAELLGKDSSLAAHAEGYQTCAIGDGSHAEGRDTITAGNYSHAEGYKCSTNSSSVCSHAEGHDTTVSAPYSHAEGNCTTALGVSSHAEGHYTSASNYASHTSGKHNKDMTAGGYESNKTGDVFVIGNGTSLSAKSNAFRVTYAGETYGLSAFQSSGADYAEYFEWLDGNTENEDRVGYFVTMEGNKIKKAESNENYILGIVSAQPCIIGNSDEDWLGRWQHDEFGRFLKREVKTYVTEWKEVQVNSDKEDEEPVFELKEIETGEYVTGWDYVPNLDYDPNQTYVERKDRKEWSAIGMMGVLAVRDDGTCKVNGFCTVKEGGIATTTNDRNGYRVIERVTENIVKVVFR